MNFQMTRFTGHKKIMITLGVGAIALTAVACGSVAPVDEAEAGGPLLVQTDVNGGGFSIRVPASFGNSDGTQQASGESVGDSSGDGSVGAESRMVAREYDCDYAVSHPSTLNVEGEPIRVPASFGNSDIPEIIMVDPAIDSQMPTLYDGSEAISVAPVVIGEVQGGSAIGMPAPGFENSGIPEMIVVDCESGSTSGSSGSSGGASGSSGGTIEPVEPVEPVEIPDLLIPVEPTDDERAVNIMVVEAPIESASVTVSESSPPQYMLLVVSGLSDGATTFGDYGVKREGNIVLVWISNYLERDVMATQVYGIHQSNIQLGSDFTSGETYEVVINGQTWTEFQAQ